MGKGRILARNYLAAVLSVALILAVTFVLQKYVRFAPSLPFVLAVAFSALFCGLGPGLVASALSVLAITYFFVPPIYSFRVSSLTDLIELMVFFSVAISVNALNVARLRAEETRRQHQRQLETVEAEAKILRSLLPICAWCKKIRHEGAWTDIETYARQHLNADITHGICPECHQRLDPK